MSRQASRLKAPSASRVPSSSTAAKRGTSKTNTPNPSQKGPDKNEPKKQQEFTLPPFSVSITGKKKDPQLHMNTHIHVKRRPSIMIEINFEELKKKMMRRQAPAGEDKKALAQIIKNLKGQKIKVQEFINMVSPYTGDQGEVLRRVLEEELAAFRKLATKVYETMTQDVSDVLVNEQMQMTNYYSERCDMLNQKNLKLITEIFEMAPDFDMGKYHTDQEEHLNAILPIPITMKRDAAEIELQRRQEMFHRLQWLRFEGTRLSEENDRLHKRLTQLKRQQKIEQERALEAQATVEAKKYELEAEEAEKSEVLQELNESLGKSMVRSEAFARLEEEVDTRTSMVPIVQQVSQQPKSKKRKVKPTWPSTIAKQQEEKTMNESFAANKSLYEEQRRTRMTPPQSSQRRSPPSPFHYSPPRSPEYMEEVTMEQTMTTVQQPRGGRGGCPTNRCGPSRDASGFY